MPFGTHTRPRSREEVQFVRREIVPQASLAERCVRGLPAARLPEMMRGKCDLKATLSRSVRGGARAR